MNTTFDAISAILAEILDLDQSEIQPGTYVLRELQAESIDLLEIGVAIQHRLGIAVVDDILFLKTVRLILARAKKGEGDSGAALAEAFPHLSRTRFDAILVDLDGGPVLQVRDLVDYVDHHRKTVT